MGVWVRQSEGKSTHGHECSYFPARPQKESVGSKLYFNSIPVSPVSLAFFPPSWCHMLRASSRAHLECCKHARRHTHKLYQSTGTAGSLDMDDYLPVNQFHTANTHTHTHTQISTSLVIWCCFDNESEWERESRWERWESESQRLTGRCVEESSIVRFYWLQLIFTTSSFSHIKLHDRLGRKAKLFLCNWEMQSRSCVQSKRSETHFGALIFSGVITTLSINYGWFRYT